MTKKNIAEKAVERVKTDNERGSRQAVIEDLFYDFNRNRVQIYWMNFVRGIFFGLGSVLGGTVLIALIVWLLSFAVDWPWVGDVIEQVQGSLQSDKK
jgi:hypothetical protein